MFDTQCLINVYQMDERAQASSWFLIIMYPVWFQCLLPTHSPTIYTYTFGKRLIRQSEIVQVSSKLTGLNAEFQFTKGIGVLSRDTDAKSLLINYSTEE